MRSNFQHNLNKCAKFSDFQFECECWWANRSNQALWQLTLHACFFFLLEINFADVLLFNRYPIILETNNRAQRDSLHFFNHLHFSTKGWGIANWMKDSAWSESGLWIDFEARRNVGAWLLVFRTSRRRKLDYNYNYHFLRRVCACHNEKIKSARRTIGKHDTRRRPEEQCQETKRQQHAANFSRSLLSGQARKRRDTTAEHVAVINIFFFLFRDLNRDERVPVGL